jgi:hypothetical protein
LPALLWCWWVFISAICRIERDRSRNISVLEPIPGLDYPLVEVIFVDSDMTGSPPIFFTVPTVSCPTAKAYVEAIADWRIGAWYVFIPFHAPVDSVIVAGENSHYALRFNERFCKGNISPLVITVVAGWIAWSSLVANCFGIDTRSEGIVLLTELLQIRRGFERNVDEGKAGYDPVICLLECGLLSIVPSNNL